MLKADFHLHTNKDPYDTWIKHTPYELIDKAAEQKFDVLCLSHHGEVVWDKKWQAYAKKKNILLIPGTEAFIEKKHILLINFTQKEVEKIKSFSDLKQFRDENHLIIASHPFFPSPDGASIGNAIHQHHNCLDALEFNSYYTSWFNWNAKGERASLQYNLPLVGNTDCHSLKEFGKTYTMIDAKKEVKAIIKAVKKNQIKIVSRPHTTREIVTRTVETVFVGGVHYLLRKAGIN